MDIGRIGYSILCSECNVPILITILSSSFLSKLKLAVEFFHILWALFTTELFVLSQNLGKILGYLWRTTIISYCHIFRYMIALNFLDSGRTTHLILVTTVWLHMEWYNSGINLAISSGKPTSLYILLHDQWLYLWQCSHPLLYS